MRAVPRLLAALLPGLLLPCLAEALSIVNSKHDLGANSTTAGPKATTQTEKCIFCHTPHRPGRNVPLWNHTLTTQTFTFYGSNYLQGYLGIARPGAAALPAGNRSRLCMSCHDGVTAVGGVYNLAGSPGTIALDSGVGTGPLVAGTAANLGVLLTDDHPVRYPVRPGAGVYTRGLNQDPEIALPPANDAVKLYDPTTGNAKPTPATGDLVECTSCHDPHDNANGKFLVKNNANAAICTTCHNKQGWAGSIHATSTAGINPTWYVASATTVGEWACRGCHRMHGANVANGQAYLLQGSEEDTCFACHRAGGAAASPDVRTPMTRAGAIAHPTIPASGLHVNPETSYYMPEAQVNLQGARRHSECQDCHDPHMMQKGNRLAKSPPNNLITPVLLGSWGVRPTAAWPTPAAVAGANTLAPMPAASYSFEQLTNQATQTEYFLCFKCHSSWSLGVGNPPYTGAKAYTTEQSREFNPNNASGHPVVAARSNIWCNATTLVAPWNGGGHYTMFCSDCHGSANAADPEGPHGSTEAATPGHGILQASLVAVLNASGNYETPLCMRCHNRGVYASKSPGAKGYSGYPDHPGNQGAHSIAPGTTGAGAYGGCLACHGDFTKAAPSYGTFHGSNWYWTAAHPGRSFVTNTQNFQDWYVITVGNPGTKTSDTGSCTPTATGCATHGTKAY